MIYVSFSPLFLFCDKKYTLKKVNSHILWLAIIDTIPLKRDTHSNISQQRCFLTAKKIFCLTGTRNTLVFPFKKQFSRQYLGFWLIYYLCNYLCLTSLHRKGYFVNFFNPWTYIHIAGCDYISTLQLFEIKLFTARFNGTSVEEASCWHILSSCTVLHDVPYWIVWTHLSPMTSAPEAVCFYQQILLFLIWHPIHGAK